MGDIPAATVSSVMTAALDHHSNISAAISHIKWPYGEVFISTHDMNKVTNISRGSNYSGLIYNQNEMKSDPQMEIVYL